MVNLTQNKSFFKSIYNQLLGTVVGGYQYLAKDKAHTFAV